MPDFNRYYSPLTSRPYLSDSSYMEYAPCETLKPYIACFWESDTQKRRDRKPQVLVIPDTCTDIIIERNHTNQRITCRLCGLQDRPVTVEEEYSQEITGFGVRFYFWAFHLFFRVDMKEAVNQMWDMELVDSQAVSDWEPLFHMETAAERIKWMERYLIRKLNGKSCNSDLYNSVGRIIKSSGRHSVKEICEYSCVSQRQMERLFRDKTGMSVKRLACLVRYQNVWRDMVKQERFEAQDAVYRYGYADQSHLLNEFRRFHGVTPDQAMRIAQDNR